MRLVRVTREPANHAPRARLPVRGVESGEGRHEVHAAVVLHLLRKRLDLRTITDEIQIVAQPLLQRAGDGVAALQSIMRRLLAELICDGGKQSKLGLYWLFVGV